MAKSKNHTNHNQSYKAHKNGIKPPRQHRFQGRKGVDSKFLRNQKYARTGTIRALRKQRKEQEKARRATKQ
ncbi:hypothetical protein GAYE_SCF41G5471 [Galdieria yellowstonensis]|uniref:60S ribosomal protein L29 n=1 Tax=Galdieria yellowstonensis TaxID=3028027 RepID=A0AAV9IJZ1_9RHOD|nr:hypothetical protein GAYE_SCF41G5471 [Galdieria yellowstonensis]